MNKTFFILFLTIMFSYNAWAEYDKIEKYEIQSAGTGVEGTYLVKVLIYSKTNKLSDDAYKYAAVHGCIFRGFSGAPGMTSAPPMASSPTLEEDREEYFKTFFESTYMNFASVVEASYKVIRLKKKGYKLEAIVQVKKDKLRHELEKSGIIKGLASGF